MMRGPNKHLELENHDGFILRAIFNLRHNLFCCQSLNDSLILAKILSFALVLGLGVLMLRLGLLVVVLVSDLGVSSFIRLVIKASFHSPIWLSASSPIRKTSGLSSSSMFIAPSSGSSRA